MCVVSMVIDHYDDKWRKNPWPVPNQIQPYFPPQPVPYIPNQPTKEEIEEFRKLLERAREYDKKNNQPNCEMEEKRKKLLDLAKELGIEINFL